MTRLGQMLMDEGMEKGIELKETDSIKKLMKNMNWTIDQAVNYPSPKDNGFVTSQS